VKSFGCRLASKSPGGMNRGVQTTAYGDLPGFIPPRRICFHSHNAVSGTSHRREVEPTHVWANIVRAGFAKCTFVPPRYIRLRPVAGGRQSAYGDLQFEADIRAYSASFGRYIGLGPRNEVDLLANVSSRLEEDFRSPSVPVQYPVRRAWRAFPSRGRAAAGLQSGRHQSQ